MAVRRVEVRRVVAVAVAVVMKNKVINLLMEEVPILLIEIDENGECSLNPEAVSILRNIQGPVSVVAVAGLYRTGKSYLLNRIIGTQTGFEIGPSVNPCTKGIWMWGKPFELEDGTQMILIDTEGLGSFERDQTVDMSIFSMALLLSSLFVYNSMGAIDEQALEELSLVCKLTEHIHIKSQSSTNPNLYSSYFPKFMWVLRDFALELVDEAGLSISANQYMERCLQPVNGTSEDVAQKNLVRKILADFFRDRECVTMVRPVNDERKLRNIQEVAYQQLRPEFREQIEDFVQKIVGNIRPKMIEGLVVNGVMLASLAESYVTAINANSIPTISTAWERAMQVQMKECYARAVVAHKEQLDKISPKLPTDELNLREADRKGKSRAYKILAEIPTNQTNLEAVTKLRQKLEEKMDSQFESMMKENYLQSQKAAQRVMKKLLGGIEEKLVKATNFEWVADDWSGILENFNSSVEGPAKNDVGFEMLNNQGAQVISKMLVRMQGLHSKEVKELKTETAELKGRAKAAEEAFEKEKQEVIELLEYERRHGKTEKKALEDAMEDLRHALEGNNKEYGKLQRNLQEENISLKQRNAELERKNRELKVPKVDEGAELRDLKQNLNEMLLEFQKTKEHNGALQQKYEYEMKIMSKFYHRSRKSSSEADTRS
jgi:hypothetical protein